MADAVRTGNVLGELTAEADGKMLAAAFCESRNYRELIRGTDFRFVVGRRGAGKSALFEKVSEALAADKSVLLVTERPSEEKVAAWHYELAQLTSAYSDARKITRLAWKVQVLTEAIDAILRDYKSQKLEEHATLVDYQRRHSSLWQKRGLARSLEAFRLAKGRCAEVAAGVLPEKMAEVFEVGELQDLVATSLNALGRRVVFLYDGLDEGWAPNTVATALLGGLAKVAAEFKESQGVHVFCSCETICSGLSRSWTAITRET